MWLLAQKENNMRGSQWWQLKEGSVVGASSLLSMPLLEQRRLGPSSVKPSIALVVWVSYWLSIFLYGVFSSLVQLKILHVTLSSVGPFLPLWSLGTWVQILSLPLIGYVSRQVFWPSLNSVPAQKVV